MAVAPGRVNIIGDHTDYNEGFALPVAIDVSVMAMAAPRDDGTVRVLSLDYEEQDEFSVGEVKRGQSWRDYVRGAVWSLREAGHGVKGADLAIESNVPQKSGLSSSAAVELAVGAAVAAASELSIEDLELARLAQRAENEFVGVQCGIMDQLAIVFARAGQALLVDCRSLEMDEIPLGEENDVAIVVIESGVERDLSKTPYNERREECAEAARQLGVKSLRDLTYSWLTEARHRMPDALFRRAQHVLSENDRVIRATAALRKGDATAAGKLMYESHASLRDEFEVSTPELDEIVDLTKRVDGVLGARLTGAGFGGSVVVLVRPDAVDALAERVRGEYKTPAGDEAAVSTFRASDGLRVTDV